MSVVYVSQTDGQFPLLAVLSRDWNVNDPRTSMALIGNDVDGIESHHRLTVAITFLRSLRAGGDSRTDDKLWSALRDDIRLRTLFKPDVNAEVELELLDDCHNS